MFKSSDIKFMTNYMKIDVTSIESKLKKSSSIKFQEDIKGAIEKFIKEIQTTESSGEECKKFINSYAQTLSKKIMNNNDLNVLDVIRHTFVSFSSNGLHQLYTCQENEDWYPKIVLTKVLSPNDIYLLDQNVKLYRGCDISEYNNGLYGQAWTTSLQIADIFAYTHYQGQEWFNVEQRVVLETIYSKDNVLFSDQSGEFEVVVNVNKLGSVNKHITSKST